MNTSAYQKPFISIIIPCRNEEQFIGRCLDSIIANDYPKERLEVLVIDGDSEDNTRHIIGKYAAKKPYIRMLDNPGKMQNLALNIGIRNSRGDIIMRMDAHSEYKYNYVSEAINALQKYGADNVGGRWVTLPRDNTMIAKAICAATSCYFGVGNAYYRLRSLGKDKPILNKPKWDINAPYFCCRREVFDKVGLIDEKLDYSEDIDFRRRLKVAGYRTLFVPTMECYYYMRTDLKSFLRHMFHNGYWVLHPLNLTSGISFSLRHLVPLAFLTFIASMFIFGWWFPISWILLVVVIGFYFLLALYFSFRLAIREKNLAISFFLPFIFFLLHLAYGLGSLVALFKLIAVQIKKALRFDLLQSRQAAYLSIWHTPVSYLLKIAYTGVTFKNILLFIVDYLGVLGGEVVYTFYGGWQMVARGGTADCKEIAVVMSGYEYPLNSLPIKTQPTIFDIGAHVGSFSLYAFYTYPDADVYSFEPSKENFSYLKKNLKKNGIGWERCKAYNFALGDYNGSGMLDVSGENNGYALGSGDEKKFMQPCFVRTLADVCREHAISRIDILKMDVEGGEYGILQHEESFKLLQEKVQFLLLEHHYIDSKKNVDWIKQRLKSFFDIVFKRGDVIYWKNKRIS